MRWSYCPSEKDPYLSTWTVGTVAIRLPGGKLVAVFIGGLVPAVPMPADGRADRAAERYQREVGERLRTYREGRRLTQTQLAARAGVSERQIRNLEAGQDSSLGTLARLAWALDLQPADLAAPQLLGTTAQAALEIMGRVPVVQGQDLEPSEIPPEQEQCAEPGCTAPRVPWAHRCEAHLPYSDHAAGRGSTLYQPADTGTPSPGKSRRRSRE